MAKPSKWAMSRAVDALQGEITSWPQQVAAALDAARRAGLEQAAKDVETYGKALEARETEPLAKRTIEGCSWAFAHRIRALALAHPDSAEGGADG